MASIIFTAKDIFDQDFKREVRGYSKDEVNEFLDDVIKDYETYAALVKELREENARLREELAQKAQETPQTSPIASTATQELPQVTTATNFDILKRLNRLEKEVFGKQIVDRDY
ncbi:cell division regulator GpsB [Streptococcus parasanguinis]|uniref:cell division regulator GpsB n=1 Tax=Streptococcus parasanguinis TaxID=1318 RepID=UPI0032199836